MSNDDIDVSQVRWDDEQGGNTFDEQNEAVPDAVQWDEPEQPYGVSDRLESMGSASVDAPESVAKWKDLSSRAGVSYDVAKAIPDQVEKKLKKPDWQTMVTSAPKTSQYLADNPRDFEIAKDDVTHLQELEAFKTELKKRGLPDLTQPQFQESPTAALNRELFSNSDVTNGTIENTANPDAALRFGDSPSEFIDNAGRVASTVTGALGTQFGASLDKISATYDELTNRMPLGDEVDKAVRTEENKRRIQAANTISEAATPTFDTNTARWVFGGVSSLVQTAPVLAVGAVNPVLGLGLAGLQAGMGQAGDVLERGGSAQDALIAGGLSGFIEIATEKNPMGFVAKNIGRMGAWNFAKTLFSRDFLGEQAATGLQDLVDTVYDPNKTFDQYLAERPEAAIQTLFGSGVNAVAMGGVQAVANRVMKFDESKNETERDLSDLNKQIDILQKTKTALLDRDVATNILNNMDDGTQDDVYIDAALFQSAAISKDVFLKVVPSAADQVDQAIETGGLIRVPRNELLVGVAQNADIRNDVMAHVKANVFGDTQSELANQQSDMDRELEAIANQSIAKAKDKDQAAFDFKDASDYISAQLDASGYGTKEGNKTRAILLASRASVIAFNNGMKPVDVVKKYMGGFRFDPKNETLNSGGFNQYAGEQALNADLTALQRAKQAVDSGADPEQTRQETGWHKWEDGKWRFEIDDSQMVITGLANKSKLSDIKRGSSAVWGLGNLIYHPALFNAYPFLNDVTVAVSKNYFDGGAYIPEVKQIQVGYSKEGGINQDTLLHEIQHAIQEYEGFAEGGLPSDFMTPETNDLMARKSAASEKVAEINAKLKTATGEEYQQLLAERSSYVADAQIDGIDIMENANDQYKRLAGEVEARDTGSRAGMSAEERKANKPYISQGIPDDQVIVRMGDGGLRSNAENDAAKYNADAAPTELSDEAADDLVTLYQELGSDDDNFQYARKTGDDLDADIISALPEGTVQTADEAVIMAAQMDAEDAGAPDIVDVKKYSIPTKELLVDANDKPILKDGKKQYATQKRDAYVYINDAGEYWTDLSDLKRAGGVGGIIYTKVADFAEKNGGVFRGDPLGLSDDALLKRTEHMASGIARRKDTGRFIPHERQLTLVDKDHATSPLNTRARAMKWVKGNDTINRREIVKTAFHNITQVMPELRHAWIDPDTGRILVRGTPLNTEFDAWVHELQTLDNAQDGQRGEGQSGSVAKQREPLAAYRHLYASASIKRQLLANTLARYVGESAERRRQILDRLGEISKDLESYDGRKLFYQSKKAESAKEAPNKKLIAERDAEYMAAVERGDMEAAQRLVDEAAAEAGYNPSTSERMEHSAPNSTDGFSVSLDKIRESGMVPDDYWTHPQYYTNDSRERSAHYDVRDLFRRLDRKKSGEKVTTKITVYRSIPKNTKDTKLRNGDWVSTNRSYAVDEGLSIPGGYRIVSEKVEAASLYWDGNSIAELGFDNGKGYAYKNTKNNRKLLDAIVRDYDGNIVPLSKRFNSRKTEEFYQNDTSPRGFFDPSTRDITMLAKADLSTFLHETGHLFLEIQAELALDENASERMKSDMDTVLKWFGVKGENASERLAAWNAMTLEEKRKFHEKYAESFEQYLFEGKAPSAELNEVFQTFRAWLSHVYTSIKNFLSESGQNADLNDEIRSVFDRMLATEEQIAQAQQTAGMMPMYASRPEGVSDAEWEAYQQAADDYVQAATEQLSGRVLRDLKWVKNAVGTKGKIMREMRREAAALRREARMEARTRFLSRPIVQAYQFLTAPVEGVKARNKRARNSEHVDTARDSLFTAIAKLGGLNKEEAVSQYGIDPKDFLRKGGVFGKPVLRKEGGLSPDAMAEALSQFNYLPLDEHGKWDILDLEDLLREEAAGNPQYSTDVDMDVLLGEPQRAFFDAENVEYMGGRLNRIDIRNMFDDIQLAEMAGIDPYTGEAVATEPQQEGDDDALRKEFTDTEKAYGGEAAYEKAKADGKTKLNYRQWVQVRTPEFKRWFGDWENDPDNASKVINPKTGEPLVVYHGTNQNITAFDPARIGLRDAGFFGSGFYSTPDEGFAQDYADTAVEDTGEGEAAAMPLYVSLQNPFIWDMSDEGADATRAALAAAGIKRTSVRGNSAALGNAKEREIFNRAVREQGYDGVIVRDEDGIQEVVAFRPEQIKSATGNSGAFDGSNPNILRQNKKNKVADMSGQLQQPAFHGSPYKFDKFSLGHIGKGEGAQAYGWGLYFAGNKEVAEYYRETLAIGKGGNNFRQMAVDALAAEGVSVDDDSALTVFQRFAMEMTGKGGKPASYARKVQNASAPMRAYDTAAIGRALQTYVEAENKGQLYKVEIPEDDTYLLWDKPLIAQSEKVKAALRSMDNRVTFGKDRESVKQWIKITGDIPPEMRAMTGGALYSHIAGKLNARHDSPKTGSQQASEYLHSIGIRGIKYLDGSSRGAGDGNYNYVIFDDSAVKILETYYQLGDKDQPQSRTLESMGVLSDDGILPELVAGYFGMETEQLIRGLLGTPELGDIKQAIENMTDQIMLERHADLATPEAIAEATLKAVMNKARAKFVATEYAILAKAAGGARATEKQAKEYAQRVIGATKVKDVKPEKFIAAAAKAGKEAQKAMAKSDTKAALLAKRNQVLNEATAKLAVDVKEEIDKFDDLAAKIIKATNEKNAKRGRDPDVVNAITAVMGFYGFYPSRQQNAMEYLERVREHDPDMFLRLQDAVNRAAVNQKDFNDLTINEMRGLREEIEGLWYTAKRSRQMEIDGKKIDLQEAADGLVTRLLEVGLPDEKLGAKNAPTEKDLLTHKLKTAGAWLTRVEQWAERMDGQWGGAFTRYIFQPVKKAADRYRTEATEYNRRYVALIDALPKMKRGLIAAPELGYTFGAGDQKVGMAELLHAVLHTGNASNKRKLLLGRGWAVLREDGTLDTARWDVFVERMHKQGVLKKEHYDFAQGVWDLLEDTKAGAQKTHRDVFGYYFAEVTADAFGTPFGIYRGGYVPAQADPRLVVDAAQRAMAEEENNTLVNAFPATAKGFTKGRTEYNKPLMLDLQSLSQHINKVLLFTHMEPAVRDVKKLLMRNDVAETLGAVDRAAYDSMLTPWLSVAARQSVNTPVTGDAGISNAVNIVRNNTGMALMAANLSNAMQQITGFLTATQKVKGKYILRETASFLARPKEYANEVRAASEYMAVRMDAEIHAINSQLNELLIAPTAYQKTKAFAARHAYFLQAMMDNTISPIIWRATFNQSVEKGMTDADAEQYANATIRQTQGSSLPEDVSRIEVGGAFWRATMQFYGYFNSMVNTNVVAVKNAKTKSEAMGHIIYGAILPAIVAQSIAVAMRGGVDDDDYDGWLDDWITEVAGTGLFRYATAMVPVVGAFANLAVGYTTKTPVDDRMQTSATTSMIGSALRSVDSVPDAITGNGKPSKAIKDVAAGISLFTGLPVFALARPVGYAADVAAGEVVPTSGGDMTRGLLTGTASHGSK